MSEFKTRFVDVKLDQKSFSSTSVRAVKEIYATRNKVFTHNIKNLDFQVCLKFLRDEKERRGKITMSPNGNILNL